MTVRLQALGRAGARVLDVPHPYRRLLSLQVRLRVADAPGTDDLRGHLAQHGQPLSYRMLTCVTRQCEIPRPVSHGLEARRIAAQLAQLRCELRALADLHRNATLM